MASSDCCFFLKYQVPVGYFNTASGYFRHHHFEKSKLFSFGEGANCFILFKRNLQGLICFVPYNAFVPFSLCLFD